MTLPQTAQQSLSVESPPRSELGVPFMRNYDQLDFKGDQNFKKFISSQLKDVNKMYEKGTSLAFVGNLGTGKTYAAACILKMALVNEYSARYVNMADVVNELVSSNTDNSDYLDKLMKVDFLVIDEFDKRWVFPSEKAEHLFGISDSLSS